MAVNKNETRRVACWAQQKAPSTWRSGVHLGPCCELDRCRKKDGNGKNSKEVQTSSDGKGVLDPLILSTSALTRSGVSWLHQETKGILHEHEASAGSKSNICSSSAQLYPSTGACQLLPWHRWALAVILT